MTAAFAAEIAAHRAWREGGGVRGARFTLGGRGLPAELLAGADLEDAVLDGLALRGIRIIVAGLDMDFRGKPFGPMPNLLAVAEYITKVHAICQHCGNLATHSYRLTNNPDTVVLGEKDAYEARCRTCYHMGNILDLRAQPENKQKGGAKERKLA